jgi:DHA2 family multidrug resistance protein-like MFS transporter
MDITSALLSLAAVLPVIYGLKLTAQDGVNLFATSTIIIGIIAGIIFIRRQKQLTDPMIDISLFKIPRFSTALASYSLGAFIVFGAWVFTAQYLQLVLGMSPLRAGLYTLPSSVAFVIGSMITPPLVRRFRPEHVTAAGLLLAALGFAMLTQITRTSNVWLIVAATVIYAFGTCPVFILATDFIIGSAPPERAGAASAISETGAEFGGAVGIAVLGSLGMAIYRRGVAHAIPAGLPQETAEAARGTLGGAIGVAEGLPDHVAVRLLEAARDAFANSLQLVVTVSAILAVALAYLQLKIQRPEQGPEGVENA